MKAYKVSIGLEIHVQLKTRTKMFCSSSADYFGAEPNSHVCPVCLGLPGALPVINKEAVESAIKFGLALNCQIAKESKFDRKNYFYPDLPKGFQISQLDLPIATSGYVNLNKKKIRVNRAHMEEDTGKLIHTKVGGRAVSLVDFNRSGVPLMEVVSEPDIESPHEAKEYAKKIHQIARYLGVADVDMEKAGMRFDANVSIRPEGQKELGTKVEIKNINSFKFLERATAFEIERQAGFLKSGKKIIQETRGWVERGNTTVPQRTKETSSDYRYFPEPDLTPLQISTEKTASLNKLLPELPDEVIERLVKNQGLDNFTAQLLAEDKYVVQWFEETLRLYANTGEKKEKSKAVANWITGEIARLTSDSRTPLESGKMEPAGFVELLLLLDQKKVNIQTAKQIIGKMFITGELPSKIIEDEGMGQISNEEDLRIWVGEALEENPKAVADFKKGKESSLGFLVGQVMKKSNGQADPHLLRDLLIKKLT